MKIAFYTLGCKVNSYETESVWELFEEQGYVRVDFKDYADVYVINTCTVTNNGDSKSRKAIRQAVKRNPESVVVVMGCYAQMAPQDIEAIDGVDIIIGTKNRQDLLEKVQRFLHERKKINDVTDISHYRVFDEIHVTHFAENTRAFLKIQDGCNNYCSYCIIPFARGPVRSRDLKDVILEAQKLVENKYLEIILSGIHTGGYGQDKDDTFYDLLLALKEVKGLKRIRISSIEMNELSPEIIDLIANNDIFAKHLHIPLQSGSNEILQLMRRKYTTQEFKEKIKMIRNQIPNVSITTDIIVGFPGETDQHFEEMVETIQEVGFSELHVFPYSKRNGTKAAQMRPQINGIIKSMRVNKLLEINDALAESYIKKNQGVIQSVLFEKSDDLYTYGHGSNYIYIKVPKDEKLHNKIKKVLITKPKYKDTLGKVMDS